MNSRVGMAWHDILRPQSGESTMLRPMTRAA
jgi:hypothetical protein